MSSDHPSHGSRHGRTRQRTYGWTVTVDAMGDDDADLDSRVDELRHLLQPYGGEVSRDRDHAHYGATFSLSEPDLDAASALTYGYEIFRDLATRAGLPRWPIVHAEVTQVAEQPTLRIVH